MSVGTRGFVYDLEALRRKQQWQLDAAQTRLGTAQREVDKQHGVLTRLRSDLDQAAVYCARSAEQRLDPAQLRQGLAFLAQLQGTIHDQKALLSQAERKRDELRKLCALRQQKVELIEQHRKTSLDAYRDAEQHRERTEADRDWLARSHWKTTTISVPTATEAST